MSHLIRHMSFYEMSLSRQMMVSVLAIILEMSYPSLPRRSITL